MRGAALWCCASLVAAPALGAQSGTSLWRPDERVVITDFSRVNALAAGEDALFVATDGGLGTYDLRFHRWEMPVTRIDGYPYEQVIAALADPVDRSVWLGTAQAVVHYQPDLEQFERVSAPGAVTTLMFDRDDPFGQIYVGGPFGWRVLRRGGILLETTPGPPPPGRRVSTVTVEEALRRMPYAEARSAFTLTDERMRQYRYTAAAFQPITGNGFFGTDGHGVVEIDAGTTETAWLPFGLLDASAGAVLSVPEGVWVGSGTGAGRVGLTFVSQALDDYRYDEGPRATGFRFRAIRDLAARDHAIWAATDRGVVRIEPGRGSEVVFDGFGRGMAETYALAQASSGVWVGTSAGLAFISDSGEVRQVDTRVVDPIYALVATQDTVWVGGALGLGVSWAGSAEIGVTEDVASTFALRDPIIALTLSADTLVAATPERIAWRAPGDSWVVERVLTGDLGRITSLAPERGGVWIGGATGVAFYYFAGRAFRVFNRAGDVPEAVNDLAVDREYLWAATEQGLVRFRKDALVP